MLAVAATVIRCKIVWRYRQKNPTQVQKLCKLNGFLLAPRVRRLRSHLVYTIQTRQSPTGPELISTRGEQSVTYVEKGSLPVKVFSRCTFRLEKDISGGNSGNDDIRMTSVIDLGLPRGICFHRTDRNTTQRSIYIRQIYVKRWTWTDLLFRTA